MAPARVRFTPITLLFAFLLTSLARAAGVAPTSNMTELNDYPITQFGAVADAKSPCTAAIQAAIDAAHSAGGGRVVIPAGVFRSGSIYLKQNVELHLAERAVLLGSNDINDYPKRPTRIEGHVEPWRMALVNAEHIERLRITGPGKIDGNGILFWAAFWQRRKEDPNCTNLEVERPRMMFIDQCRDVTISGLELRDSGFWNIHLYRCRGVLIKGTKISSPTTLPIRAPSTDGVDVDSCQDVVIRKCDISVDDDCIALKGSKGPVADKDPDSPPVDNVLVEDCTFGEGHGVVTLGSESTVVRNVTVRNCVVTGKNAVVRLKLRPDTPQLYENLLYENIRLTGSGKVFDVKPWTQFFDLQGHAPPTRVVRNVTVRNLTGDYGDLGTLKGNPGDTIDGVRLENIDLKLARGGWDVGEVKNGVVENVKINGREFKLDEHRATTSPQSRNDESPEWLDASR
jgi:polygalacturonase